ncbi:MAG: THUMP domain-containing protein, partial [Bacteroidota bacterium]
ALMYRANLYLRTALRILRPIYRFKARDEHSLYKGIQHISWHKYLSPYQTLAIDAVVHSPHFRHSKFVALKCKDAVVDQIRRKAGKRPSVDVGNPDLRIHIHISNDSVSVALDSSANSLHRRAYRLDANPAPLNEALAAGLLLKAGYKGEENFVDPMCGSGTLLIEAAMIATHTAPGLLRESHGFEKWNDFEEDLWEEIKEEAKAKVRKLPIMIQGSDISADYIDIAKNNIQRAGFEGQILIEKKDIAEVSSPGSPGLILVNPPYGERLQIRDLEALYKKMGDTFKQVFSGYTAWVFSSNVAALKRVGLRPDKKETLYNGPLECKFYKYSLYTGSREK